MKYNKQEIMKRAWELKKTTDNTFSVCLKKSWAEAKRTEEKSEKALLVERLDFLADYANKLENGYQYNTYISVTPRKECMSRNLLSRLSTFRI